MNELFHFVRSPYNYDMDQASDDSGLHCRDPSLAVQDQRDEVDINTIVRRFGLTGELPVGVRAPSYGDFTDVMDYHSSMNAIMEADARFMRLPADVRERFDNDAGKFVDFASEPRNAEQLKDWGMLLPEAVEKLEANKAKEVARIKELESRPKPKVE